MGCLTWYINPDSGGQEEIAARCTEEGQRRLRHHRVDAAARVVRAAPIEMNNIVKKYGDGFPAVNDVSLDIDDGEFMILVGPSGCGKSTLLRMIVGLEDVTTGDMIIGGTRVNDKAPRDRNLSMVFQNYALYPHLSVYENIAFPLRLSNTPDDEVCRRVTEAADVLELHEHLERKPANLSGGQRQRVAMGRAIVRQAEAFLFDEPLARCAARIGSGDGGC
jgi:multiple sugar transport system ATP-binding protein